MTADPQPRIPVTTMVNVTAGVLRTVVSDVDGPELLRVIAAAVAAGNTWPEVIMAVVANLPTVVRPDAVPAAEAALRPLYLLALAHPDAPAAPA